MFFFPSRSNNRTGLLIECSKLTCFARESDMVPGRRDRSRRSTSVAVRRTCGAVSELEEGKIGSRTTCPNSKHKEKTHYRHTNSSPDGGWQRSSTGGMLDARTSQCSGLTLDRSCSACSTAMHIRHLVLGCRKAFSLGWRTVLLSTSIIRCQVSRQRSWQATRTCSAEEEEGHRKCAYGKDGVKRRQLWRSLRRFWQLFQPGSFFVGNNVLWTTVWSLSIDVSFNLQDGRTLLTCPFLASWTAFVCAWNGGRTRRASKRRPRAAEVMARTCHVLRVLEVRGLPLRHFQVLAFERSTMTKIEVGGVGLGTT